jgi:ABC-type transporter Mla subunit MlaD
VRALFDDAGFAVAGEQVRIAGAPVGTISSLSVTHDNLAAVTLSITNREFTPWYANATCTIRPQSLIAERYVDCNPGTSSAAPLRRIRRGPGAGSYLLPVTRTSSPIDPDLVQNISQEPVREALSVILNELGTGLAARGSDLNAVIRRADPALASTNQVFRILASQNQVLAKLADDADTVLAPLARVHQSMAGFVKHANTTATATAERSAELSNSIRLLPPFLEQLKPLMAELGQLADQGTPLMATLGQSAAPVSRELADLTPFANAARTALLELGAAAESSRQDLVNTVPLVRQLQQLGNTTLAPADSLAKLTASLDSTGGIEQLMALLFYGAGATNGFDSAGHYVRTAAIFGSCTAYARTPVLGCSANFAHGATAAAASAARRTSATTQQIAEQAVRESIRPNRSRALARLLGYLVGGGGR